MDLNKLSRERARDLLRQAHRFHFIGVGGVGMSALARILAHEGKSVSGTDRDDSPHLDQMRREGLLVKVGHSAEAVHGAEAVVATTALQPDNVELMEARRLGLPILHRAELLAAIAAQKPSVAVTGTHGKSTTTAMTGHVLAAGGLDPLVIVGGDVNEWGGNVRFGSGPWTIFEACESDHTLLLYEGSCQVITSLEPDHLDQYKTFDALCGTMRQFVQKANAKGFVVYNTDSETVQETVRGAPAQSLGYGVRSGDYRIRDVVAKGEEGLSFRLEGPSGSVPVSLRLYGPHNAMNAAAALAVGEQLGVPASLAAESLAAFQGVARRFERLGSLGTSIVIDDYAHHPTEISACLSAAREHLDRPILAIFQPHLYTRTRDLMPQFAEAFGDADDVIITEIYAAREEPIPCITGEVLAKWVAQKRDGRSTRFLSTFDQITEFVRQHYRNGWAVLVIGAGDIRKVGERLVERA